MKAIIVLALFLFEALSILDRSYYDALCTFFSMVELPVSASSEDIREAFRKLSKKYHPDRNPKSRERF
jgi:DnaJ-class molecular chaperone